LQLGVERDPNVLCAKCEVTVTSMALKKPRVRWSDLADPVAAVLCNRCGAVLPSPDPTEGMLSKLQQLSRFGLGADDRPLLASAGAKKEYG